MSDRRDDIYDTLSESKKLVGDLEVPTGDEYSLNSILAEFGQGAAEPAPKKESAPQPEAVAEEAPAASEPAPRRAKVLQFPGFFAPPVQEETEEEPAAAETPAEEVPVQAEAPVEEAAREELPLISVEDVMARTVSAVLEEDDALLEEKMPLREQLGFFWANVKEKGAGLLEQFAPAGSGGSREKDTRPEPDMEQAVRMSRRRCKTLKKQFLLALAPLVLLLAVTVADTWFSAYLPALWRDLALLRCGVTGGLLGLVCLLSPAVWREALRELKKRRVSCEAAAALSVAVVLGDCLYAALADRVDHLPLAAPAALLVVMCLLGQLLLAQAKRDAFRLADLGGRPPYAVSVTSGGACKQQGRMEGFYNTFRRSDPSRQVQTVLLPLLLSAVTVLSGVVCIGGERMEDFLWVWSAMLTASLPLGLPLCGTLSVRCLNRRLSRSGCAVAGFSGARAVSGSRRMVVTDSDVFPPGTVSMNGLKTYGEEIGKVLSYAATVAEAAGSQLQPLFEQLLAAEGGERCAYDDLHFYEEGGVGITIRGESVTMGSEFFMKKMHVTLPRELKVKTGAFLAVDGQLIAIFAIKYQASHNVEWALRALRRSRIEPVLAVRSGNITPGLLKKRFGVDAKPVYPDVSGRLALSDLTKERAEEANAILYREGLMPFAEVVIGSRRCCRMVWRSIVLCWLGSLCGLLLSYYLTGAAAYGALSAGAVLAFGVLWLLPAVLLGDLTRRY